MAELDPRITGLFSKMALFKGIPAASMQRLAQHFTLYTLDDGDVLFKQGDVGDSFYVILSGKLQVIRGKSNTVIATLGAGDYVGEEALLFGRYRSASVKAIEHSEVLRLDNKDFAGLLRDFPQIRLFLVATIETRRLARAHAFSWLGPDETVYLMARKHLADLYVSLVWPVVLGWVGVALEFIAYSTDISALQILTGYGGALVLIAALVWGAWNYIDWGNDFYIVTNQRVVWLEKVVGIYDSRQEAPLTTVQTVVTQTDQLGRMVGFGNVIVRTITGSILMPHVGYPAQLAGLIEEQISRAKQSAQKAETAALESTIRQRLGLPVKEPLKPAPSPAAVAARAPRPPRRQTWFDNFLKVEYSEGGVVTFRKHWILLLEDIWIPTLIYLLLVAILVARIFEVFTFLSVPMIALICGGFSIFPLAWWFYEYVDWRNDIYQLTPDQIIDIYRKPLGPEDKKAAAIDNILSLQHERRGIIGLLLNYGNVTAMVGAVKFTFEGVYNPAGVEQEIFERINSRKKAQRDAEAQRERDRIADWLAAYHRSTEELRGSGNPQDTQ